MKTAYTHIRIERVPQRLDEDFTKNADIADQQKTLAEAAPDLLDALNRYFSEMEIGDADQRDLAGFEILARKAIAKATGN